MSDGIKGNYFTRKISFYYDFPTCILLAAMGLFLRAVLKARMFPEAIAEMCMRQEVLLTAGVLLLRMLYVVVLYQVFSRKAGMRDE